MQFQHLVLVLTIPNLVSALSNSKPSHRRDRFESLEEKLTTGNWSVNEDSRIMGGEIAFITDYPWVALLWASLPSTVIPLTNSIIVNKYYAITTNHAIHAIPDPNIKLVLVINFNPNNIQNQIIRSVKEIIQHNDFVNTWQYDIVLVRVCPGIPPTFHAPLAAPSDIFTSGDPATMISFSLGLNKATKLVTEWCECERYPDWTMDQHLCLECSSNIYADFPAYKDLGMVPTIINGKVSAMVLSASHDCLHAYGDIALNLAKFSGWITQGAVYDESM